MKKHQFLLLIFVFTLIIIIIPPIQPAPFTINNNNWDGLSEFKELVELQMNVTESTIPLRLIGGTSNYDVIIIVGGNLPYFSEDSNFLYHYVRKGGNVILFEDHGYASILPSAFGISLGGTVIDNDSHLFNPYQPVINQPNINIAGYEISNQQVVFNKAVGVHVSRLIANTTYYPLFKTEGATWEDSNRDGQFYRGIERRNEPCYLGAVLDFNEGGKFVIVGDSAFPTNDLIDLNDNKPMITELLNLLVSDGAKSVLFDESRKIWIPPTGKAAIGILSVLIMGLFHSPIIAISVMIILGGFIGIKKEEQVTGFFQKIRQSWQPKQDLHPVAAFIQSEEEEELARLAKSEVISDLYRSLLADEIRSFPENLTVLEKVELEYMLRQQYINVKDYDKLLQKLELFRKRNTEID